MTDTSSMWIEWQLFSQHVYIHIHVRIRGVCMCACMHVCARVSVHVEKCME